MVKMSSAEKAREAARISERIVKCIVGSHERIQRDRSLLPKDYSATGLVVRDQIEAAQRQKKEGWDQTLDRLARERNPIAKGTEMKSAAKSPL